MFVFLVFIFEASAQNPRQQKFHFTLYPANSMFFPLYTKAAANAVLRLLFLFSCLFNHVDMITFMKHLVSSDGGSERAWNKCPRLTICFWQMQSRSGLVFASKPANPLHSRTSVPFLNLYVCRRGHVGLHLDLAHCRAEGTPSTSSTLHDTVSLCLPTHRNLPDWDQTHWVQTLPLTLVVNCIISGQLSKLSEPQFPHLSHWDDLTL